ncbi:glycosyltransferase family protein [Goodfellowiella coeruleoviolacea]|uniref:Glycosyltransferase n=1 Tax=Goodfellowiella coeruleoviolacea TaxID=334858 RepID=A0AAE3KHF8_9PSEU|nr:hypothetical protein [Goodfellowiella coeruleoviolacea]MCP2168246.1 hypothetical protein [Goodfellowiella coeruleoviolacea]
MRLGVVSGDGLPVSGLLTIFRNVRELGVRHGLVDPSVPADLGYSWRPDKGRFYPGGAVVDGYPDWLRVITTPPTTDPAGLRHEWERIRTAVANPERLPEADRALLRQRVGELAEVYREHFATWLREQDVDWVIAINMTLSDAVPVTAGLHAAVRDRFGAGRHPGGIVFWDHDLFGSCAIFEHGVRLYPAAPNEFVPVPQDNGYTRWAVVSADLAAEAARYPTDLAPRVVPNVLPPEVRAPLTDRHHEFARQWGLDLDRPVILCPVRVFRVKGVELSVELLGATSRECERRGLPRPYLLVFGSLAEDPDYAEAVLARVDALDLAGDVLFLDGVPLGSYRDGAGRWRLDEVDLLRLAAATSGMVFFTPNTPDVETVGLGPALGSLAHLPTATTAYTAFDQVYGPDYRVLRVGASAAELRQAGPRVVDALTDPAARHRAGGGGANLRRLAQVFPVEPWLDLLAELHAAVHPAATAVRGEAS